MKQFLFLFICLFAFVNTTYSQKSLSDYAYVLVPQQFEFQKGKDQYQVNTLTRHLLNKAGFNAIYEVELENLPRCEGLFLDLDLDPSFFFTKIKVILRDCNYNIVYESQEGRSKKKEYKEGFHEAIRAAFGALEKMGVDQGDLQSFRESVEKSNTSAVTTQAKAPKNKPVPVNLKKSKSLAAYDFDGEKFYLEANERNFIIYKRDENNQDFLEYGTLVETSRAGIYLFNKDGKSQLANFDDAGNLLIDGVDTQGNPIQNKYQKVKEN